VSFLLGQFIDWFVFQTWKSVSVHWSCWLLQLYASANSRNVQKRCT